MKNELEWLEVGVVFMVESFEEEVVEQVEEDGVFKENSYFNLILFFICK